MPILSELIAILSTKKERKKTREKTKKRKKKEKKIPLPLHPHSLKKRNK
jgi:hypothetical protein